MALPVSVTLVAFATKLFRISRKHCLDGCSPGMQAQTVEAALELLKSFDHQRRQCQRTCRQRRTRSQRRTLVEPLQFDMLRHGVDLLALGLRFATSSLAA
jgi:7-keto-8-aminopelargonate synthetase-like enzyme